MGQRPTAADVAALAGVSRSTVSYILNGSGMQTFAPETVEKVRSAADRLAYTPQAAARALRRGESGVVLLPLPDLPASANFSTLLSVLTDGVRAAGRSMTSLALRPGNGLTDILRDISPAALLEVLPLPDADRAAAVTAGVPVLSVADAIQRLDHAAAAEQVRHLASLGHRRLAVVTATKPSTREFARARLAGSTEAAEALGLPPLAVEEVDGPPHEALDRVAARLREWASGPDPVTAVCAFNDLFAAAVTAAAARAGLRVPDDLAVVGIDDEPLGGLLSPALTTVRFDYTAVGEHLGEQLRHVLDRRPSPETPPRRGVELVVRESTRR
ncbi:substrate-binding domain-containing protein [Cellulomonas hominis]|uniref:substrate-binding domain-containing protein n=1 Tax=Cellulomonas hominis TaxID=156981 RepID=UPI001443F926|nr:LacI family transcriptional regulator [Cellulomonas hominis]